MKKFKMESGSKTAHENFNKSNDARRGRVALIQIIINIKTAAFENSQKACSK